MSFYVDKCFVNALSMFLNCSGLLRIAFNSCSYLRTKGCSLSLCDDSGSFCNARISFLGCVGSRSFKFISWRVCFESDKLFKTESMGRRGMRFLALMGGVTQMRLARFLFFAL